MSRKNLKPIPEFKSEAEEREFGKLTTLQPILNGKGGTCAVPESQALYSINSIRLPISLLEQIKIEANKRDVSYQSLIKVCLQRR